MRHLGRFWRVCCLVLVTAGVGVAFFYVPPAKAHADVTELEFINIPAEQCVQISGTSVTRNTDGITSNSIFKLRCPLKFINADGADAEITYIQGNAASCGGYQHVTVKRRALAVGSAESTVAECEVANGAGQCSDSPNHVVSYGSHYYYMEFQQTVASAGCEVAGGTVGYNWTDDT